jgi:hypothetical protein
VGDLGVRAEARTYLRGKGNGKGNGNRKGKGNGRGKGKGKGNGNRNRKGKGKGKGKGRGKARARQRQGPRQWQERRQEPGQEPIQGSLRCASQRHERDASVEMTELGVGGRSFAGTVVGSDARCPLIRMKLS